MDAPQGPPPGLENVDRGPSQMAIWWSEFSIVFVLVVARLVVRGKSRAIGVDDWMIVASLILYAVTCAMVTHLALIGGFRHLAFLTLDQQLAAVKWNWISQAFGITLYSTSKASVALLLIRILGPRSYWRRIILYFTMVLCFVWNGVQVILQFMQCTPKRALWNPTIPGATCWNPSVQENIAISGVAYNIFVDFLYALLPITIIWVLQMSIHKKILLGCILGLGVFAGITGIVKTKYLVALTARSDLTWESYNLYAWTAADIFLVHFCACIPPLRPVFEQSGKYISGASSRMKEYLINTPRSGRSEASTSHSTSKVHEAASLKGAIVSTDSHDHESQVSGVDQEAQNEKP